MSPDGRAARTRTMGARSVLSPIVLASGTVAMLHSAINGSGPCEREPHIHLFFERRQSHRWLLV